MRRKNSLLLGMLASILSFTAASAATVEIATQKSTISNKAEMGAGTVLKLWLQDDQGNRMTADADYTVNLDSSNDAVVNDFSFVLATGTVSTLVSIGGAGTPNMSVTGQGSTNLKATAISGSTSLNSDEIPLTVVADYLTASFTNLSNGTNIGKFVDISLTNGTAPVTAPASVTHVAGGIGSKPVETVPSSLVANMNGNLRFYFTEPTATRITAAGNEYYIVSSAGFGDALIAGDGDTIPDIVIPNMSEMPDNPDAVGHTPGITAGVSKQDGTFVSLFDGQATVSEMDVLNIALSIKPKAEHVGLAANKAIVAVYADIFNIFGFGNTLFSWSLGEGRTSFVFFDMSGTLTPDDSSDDGFVTYEKGKILTAEPEAFHIYSGPLTGLPGLFGILAGYQLVDSPETLVFNDQYAGLLTIQPAQ